MWNQLIDANWRIPYIGGWCEGFVEGGFGQAALPKQDQDGNWYTTGPYGSATNKWESNPGNGNHPGELPPVGKTVPVYFSLGSTPQGHTAISLDDGMVASSTQWGIHSQGYIHPNLDDMIAIFGRYNNGCTYLGWSEYAGNAQVLQYQGASDDEIRQAYLDILERPADDGGLAHFRAFTIDQVRTDLLASDERKLVVARHDAERKAAQDAADKAVADKLAADAEIARLAEVARLKVLQDAKDAQALADAQAADAKARADAATQAATQAASDHSFIFRLQNLITLIINFFTKLKG